MLARFQKMFGSPEEVVVGFGDFEQKQHRKYKEPVRERASEHCFGRLATECISWTSSARAADAAPVRENAPRSENVNPRPWRRATRPVVIRHGLVKCKTCARLWNRDTNASRNIHKIMTNEIAGLDRPAYLRRAVGSLSGATSASA